MTDPIQPLIDDAPASNYEGDNYDAGYLQGLIDAQDAIGSFAVVQLPEIWEPDEDGQIYFDATLLRIDTTGLRGERFMVFEGRAHLSPGQLRRRAAEYLAAANYAEENQR